MMLDLLKKSQNSKLWNFFNKRIFDLQLEKFLSPKIFLFNFNKLNIDVNNLYSYSKNFPHNKWNDLSQTMKNYTYQSEHNLQNDKIFFETKKQIENFLNQSIIHFFKKKKSIGKFKIKSMWFVIMKKNTSHHIHFHPKSALSGVLYLKIKKSENGKLKILIPKNNMEKYKHSGLSKYHNELTSLIDLRYNEENQSLIDDKIFSFAPSENDMILFNSYFYHWVDEYNETEDRISIAWDAIFTI